ncbi:MAG: hypothetical protein AAGC46_09930 [Solirubrobacteraceae bacterium]|nr:hypothetical protein [Patulibacter sp.]
MQLLRLDDLRNGLADAEREERDSPGLTSGERAARARRWLDLGDDRERFAALATDFGSTEHLRVQVAGFAFLAGDAGTREQIARGLEKPYARDFETAGVHYLLGDDDRAIDTGADDVAVDLALLRRSGDPGGIAAVRERRLIPHATGAGDGPHVTHAGDPLTPWDWIEETFRLEAELTGTEVPSHEEMLRRLGVLTDVPRPGPPAPRTPPAGLHLEGDGGVLLRPFEGGNEIQLGEPGQRGVWVREQFDLWGAALLDEHGELHEWILDPIYADWRHAAIEGARIFGADYDAHTGRVMEQLVLRADGDPGEAIAAPTPEAPPRPPLPTIQWDDLNETYDLELRDDLAAELRESRSGAGWDAKVLFRPSFDRHPVSPPSHTSWQDAAHAVIDWLKAHRDGYGVAELERILADPDAHRLEDR